MKKLWESWLRRSRWVRFALIATLLVSTGAAVWFASATAITGTVRCASYRPVSGLWVEGRLGHVGSYEVNSGFAKINRNTDVVTFSWVRHLGGAVEFHVGCGAGQWQFVGYSPRTSLTHLSIVCDDDQGQSPGKDVGYTVKALE